MKLRSALQLLAPRLVPLLAVAGCIQKISLEDRSCPCVAGWTCDPATYTCIRPYVDASTGDAIAIPDAGLGDAITIPDAPGSGDAGGFPDAFPGGGDAGGFPDAFPGGDAGGFPDAFPGGDAGGFPDAFPGGDAGGFPDAFPGGDAGGFPDAFPGGDAGGFPDAFPGGGGDAGAIPDAFPGGDAGGGEGPSARFTVVPPNATNVATASFEFFSSDPAATFACELDMGGFVPCSSPHALAGVTDGPHTLTLRATGASGIPTLVPYSWVVDTTPPTVTIIVGPSDVSNVSRPTFVFTVNEAVIFFQCDVDGSGFFVCHSPDTLPPLADGPHTFTVRATDLFGNLGPTTQLTWTIDTSGG